MQNIITIFRKELVGFFNSLVGYIALGAFLVLTGLFFWIFNNGVLYSGLANMDMLFGSAPYLFLFLIPAITMGAFSEEFRAGTFESLMTKPVTPWQVILGKYLAAATVVLISLIPTLIYYWSIYYLSEDPSALQQDVPAADTLRQVNRSYQGRLDHGPIIGAYIGLYALGLVFVAVGMLTSALTKNQVVAFIIGCVVSFFLYDGFTFISELEIFADIATTVARIGVISHFDSISRGLLDTRDIFYFLSVIVVMLAGTRLALAFRGTGASLKRRGKVFFLSPIVLIIAIVLFGNVIFGLFYARVDLTDDQRHTISEVTQEILEELQHPIFVTVYFAGDLPPYYATYTEGMENFLSEMSIAGGRNFDYQFVDPSGDEEMYKRFAGQGFPPVQLSVETSFTSTEQLLVLPYVEITYQQKTSRMNLIKNAYRFYENGSVEIFVDEALRRFEYLIVGEIYNKTREKFKTIGLLKGHGEYTKEDLGDLLQDTDRYYNYVEVDLRQGKEIGPGNLDLLLVMQPETALSEREKYEIDQYLMRGGRVIFLVNFYKPDFTTGEQVSAFTFTRNNNLDDLFMKHGVKLQYNLLNDKNSGNLALGSYTAALGSENVQVPWPFYPRINDLSAHSTTRYLGQLLLRYCSSIDTFYTDGVDYTVLMRTSTPTRIRENSPLIDLNSELAAIKARQDLNFYREPGQITGLLVEGQLRSLFENRPIPTDSMAPAAPQNARLNTVISGAQPKYALISDGEFAKAIPQRDGQRYLPLENKTLMINLFDYLTDQDILTRLRPRNYIVRRLDKDKTEANRLWVQILNFGLPLGLIISFGIGRVIMRRWVNARRVRT